MAKPAASGRLFDQVIVPLDGVKPTDERKGWDQQRLQAHNQERFHDLLEANWDLVVVDEAHKLSGASHLVARYRLGQGLAGGGALPAAALRHTALRQVRRLPAPDVAARRAGVRSRRPS